jgi:hypothetical protein
VRNAEANANGDGMMLMIDALRSPTNVFPLPLRERADVSEANAG